MKTNESSENVWNCHR